MSPESNVIALCHHRWSVPLMAELHRRAGAKFVELVRGVRLSRDSLSRTLDALIRQGVVMRNPGYGHPMRPEYVLTAAGATLGPIAQRLMGHLRALEVEDVVLRKWSIPVLLVLCQGEGRYSSIKASLPGVSPRALTQTLKDLQKAGLLQRVVLETYPPTVHYQLTPLGQSLRTVLRDFTQAATPIQT